MIRVTIPEAQANFEALLDRALAGETVLIVHDGGVDVQLAARGGDKADRDILLMPLDRPEGLASG